MRGSRFSNSEAWKLQPLPPPEQALWADSSEDQSDCDLKLPGTCNHTSTYETETEVPGIQVRLQLYSGFQASLGYKLWLLMLVIPLLGD